MAPREVYIAVIGAGGVGHAFLSQLSTLSGTLPGVNLRLVLLARSRTCIQAPDFQKPLSLEKWSEDLAASQSTTPTPQRLVDYLASGTKAGSACVLVDNTATSTWPEAYPLFLSKGIHVVTPNKKGFSASSELWDAIQSTAKAEGGGMIFHEASVGAGLPVISTLDDLLATGDQVERIEGVFSGTLSFLFNLFAPVSPGKEAPPAWSAAVKNAKALGYTEPDARDDLSGMDVARKLTILARRCGVQVAGPEAFPVQSLVPSSLAGIKDADEFLTRLPECDAEMEKLRAEATEKGAVLRYVGSLDTKSRKLEVKLQHVPKNSPIAGLQGSDNLIAFHTKRYDARPLVIQGAGAGADVTAMGVTADLIRVLQRLG